MADRIYGIQQGQPADVADYFRSRNRVQDLPLIDHIYEVSTLKANTTKARATDSYDLLFGDEVEQYVDNLADGRQRIYRKINLYVVGHGTVAGFDTNLARERLAAGGYTEVEALGSGSTAAGLLALTGEADNGQYADLNNYLHFAIKAGAPRYVGAEESIVDAPSGGDYIRRNGEWVEQDLTAYDTIASVDSKIAGALGSTFTSRQILTTADTSVFADGAPASPDPTGTSGWYYRNLAGAKINWYFYAGGEDTDTLGALDAADGGFYMVVDARNTTSWPYLTVYTERENDGSDASWYRSRLTYGPGGGFANKLSSGLHILHTANFDGTQLTTVQGKYPTAVTTQISVETFSSAGPQLAAESLWLLAVSTSSGTPEGQEEFVLRESGLSFGGKTRTIQYVANPAQQPEYTNYFRGSFTGSANFPESGELDQWLIETGEDKMYVWDVEGGTWVKTGTEAVAPTAAVNDYPYQYVYSSFDGSGYGFEAAQPEGNWSNTPDGKLQSTGFSSDILSRRIKFATLKSPGDEVTFQCSNNTTAYYRYGFYALTPGTDSSSLSWKVAGQPANGTTWMLTDQADRDLVEFQMSYMEPYFGGTSYGYNLTGRSNSTGIGYTGNAGELPVTFRVADDYRIEIFIDGHFHVRTQIVPTSGVDIYWHGYGETGRILEQPTGSGANIQGGTAPSATGAHYYMSDAAPARVEATVLASGNGYWLYSDTEASGTGYNVELTDAEASAARYCRVFQDFTGATLYDRVDAMRPVIGQDRKVLDHVQEDARGYFHSQDLTLTEQQSKLALFGPALEAATGGAVEITLAILQGLTIPAAATSGLVAFTPNYTFDGTSHDSAYEVYTTGDAFYDTYGIDKVEFSGSFVTINFKDASSFNAWRAQTHTMTINCDSASYTWEDTHTLDLAAEYSANTQYNYVHYQPSTLDSAERDELSDLVASTGAGNSVIDVGFNVPAPTSTADAVNESTLVDHMVMELQEHLQKFPR